MTACVTGSRRGQYLVIEIQTGVYGVLGIVSKLAGVYLVSDQVCHGGRRGQNLVSERAISIVALLWRDQCYCVHATKTLSLFRLA